MAERIIQYSKGYSLHHDDSVVFFAARCNTSIQNVLKELKKKKITEIFFIPEKRGISREKLSAACASLSKHGVKCSLIPHESILSGNFDFYLKTGRYLNSRLKSSGVLFLYEKSNADDAEAFIASVLLASRDSVISAEQAVLLATGKDYAPSQYRKVCEFKNFLDDTAADQNSSANGSSSDSRDTNKNRRNRMTFSIRAKLLLINTLIAGGSMIILIASGTILIREHSENLVKEYNLSIARIAGLKISQELAALALSSKIFSQEVSSEKNPAKINETLALYFKENPSVLFIGFAEKNPNSQAAIRTSYRNSELFEQFAISDFNISRTFQGLQFPDSQNPGISYENISSYFNVPAMAVIIPLGRSQFTVVLMETSSLLKTFQSTRQSKIFQLFMVNAKGRVLLHSSENILRSEQDLSDIPIVSEMMKNETSGGYHKYVYNGSEFIGSFYIMKNDNLGLVSAAETGQAFRALYKIQRQNILILIIVLTLGFVLVYYFASSMTKPLVNLMGAAMQIEEGVYDINIRAGGRDEIGLLTESFLSMAKRLKEKEQLKNIFGKFIHLNREITNRVLSKDLNAGGGRKKCTILFCSIRNLTDISESFRPDRVIMELNDYFTRMVDCIYKNEGIVDKFMGDSFMAHWGALYNSSDDPGNAVKTALEMRNTLIRYNMRSRELNRPLFKLGCGIQTGMAIAGQIGSSHKTEFTVIGDTVNSASKIEILNLDFRTDILISESTKNEVDKFIRTVELGPVKLHDGREENIYAVLGYRNDPECPGSLEELKQMIEFNIPAGMVR